jgi:hypothetical protein
MCCYTSGIIYGCKSLERNGILYKTRMRKNFVFFLENYLTNILLCAIISPEVKETATDNNMEELL